MTRSQNRRRAAPRSNRNNLGQRMAPPQIKSNVMFKHKFRFVSTSATATSITPTSLLGAAGTVCYAVNANVAAINASVKLNRISMWSPPSAQGSSVTCSVDWIGSANSPNQEISDTSVSVAQPAYLSTSPPNQSIASFWHVSSDAAICTLVAPVGTIIDVDLDLVLQDDDLSAVVIAVAVGAAGVQYFLSLDPNATHRYIPVSLTTTA